MKRIVVTEYVSLDGVFENPAWTRPYWCDEIAKYKFDELFSSDVLLLGRETYQGFAAAWPSQKDEQGFADRMNGLPKVVVSSTLEQADWNNSSIINENMLEEIARLKQAEGADILVYGSASLAHLLLEHGLVDEIRLLVYPLVLGKGRRLFAYGLDKKLKLGEVQTFPTGVIALAYHPE